MNLKGKALKYMKSLKIKKIYGVIKYILVILSVCLMLSSCNKPQTTELANSETKKEIEFDIEKVNRKVLKLLLYIKIYIYNQKKQNPSIFRMKPNYHKPELMKLKNF